VGIRGHTWIRTLGVVTLAWLVLGLRPVAMAADPTFAFDPASGVAGQEVTISGSGWNPDDGDVKVFLPGADADTDPPWTNAPVDDTGGFSKKVQIPVLAAGLQSFLACQTCNFLSGDSPPFHTATFNILPDLKLDQQRGSPGTAISVTGSGWSQNDGDVTLFVSREASIVPANLLVAISPLADGTLGEDSTFNVPPRSKGTYTFFACQQCANGDKERSIEVPFEITDQPVKPSSPALSLQPDTASVGQQVTASGVGWSDSAGLVSVFADESDMFAAETPLGTAWVSGGVFNTTVTVPDTQAESLTMFACQRCGDSDLEALARLSIEEAAQPHPLLQVLPTTGSPGREVRATGTGWPDGEVTVFARRSTSAERVALERATATDGAFEQTLTVPRMRAGPIEIGACQRCGMPNELSYVVPFTVVSAKQDHPSLNVEPRSVQPGDIVTISGTGWLAKNGEVTVYLEQAGTDDRKTVWFHLTPERDGTFSTDVEAPDRDPGTYRVVACQRCDDARGFRQATKSLAISGGSDLRLLGAAAAVALLVAAFLTWLLLRRGPRSGRPRRTDAPDQPDPHLPAELPVVRVVFDDTFDVQVRADAGGPTHVELPSLDVLTRPDPGPLADQVEVTQ